MSENPFLKGRCSHTAVVVSDDATQRHSLSHLLQTSEITVQVFDRAAAALRAMAEKPPPKLIITDLCLPEIDGWQFCNLLRSPEFPAYSQVPIMVVSATLAGTGADRITGDLGADAVLPFPVDGKAFMDRALSLLSGRTAPRVPRVLIVADSSTRGRLIKQAFIARGFQADTAFSVQEARKALANRSYDTAVLDYHLPDGKGDSLLDLFHDRHSSCDCLMMATDPTPELALSWMQRGAAAYLCKPFDPMRLTELSTQVRRKRALLSSEIMFKERSRRLHGNEELLQFISANTSDGIAVIEEDRISYATTAYARMLGFEHPNAQIGWTREDILAAIHPDDRETVLGAINQAIEKKKARTQYIFRARTADGRYIWREDSTCFIYDENNTYRKAVVVCRDITERKLAEQERENLQAQLIQAQKMESVGRLAGGVAHDFNNKLGVILGYVEVAMEEIQEDHALSADLKEIQSAARHSVDLTKQLLAFARKQTISPRKLELNKTVESMLNMLRRLIGEDIELVWKPASHLCPVKMDPSQIDQILANLCINARDAIAGVGRINIETGRQTFDEAYCSGNPECIPGDYIELSISDNGCGMDKDTLDNLFEPFFTTKEVDKGTGLGLATVYGIVKQNNGFISVYSEPGIGSHFKIYLPGISTDFSAAMADKPRIKTAAGGTETILLVEDDPAILTITCMMMERYGYTVISAATPGKAIEKAKNHAGAIDLLMTDVVMPEMNGRDLSERIAAIHPGIRLLFMSGYTADIIAHQGVLDDGVAFIQKPFSMTDMAEKLREVLA
jgi:PAS domain S-box-containing protein